MAIRGEKLNLDDINESFLSDDIAAWETRYVVHADKEDTGTRGQADSHLPASEAGSDVAMNAPDDDLSAAAVFNGGSGNDTYQGGNGTDHIFGNGGNDWLLGDDGNDFIYGGTGSDTLTGGFGNDHIEGGTGGDVLNGRDDADTLYGGDSNDRLNGGNDVDTLYGGAGGDIFEFTFPQTGDVSVGQADEIGDFQNADTITIHTLSGVTYTYAGSVNNPGENQYSIWWNSSEDAWMLTWNSSLDSGYHDVIVRGDNPLGDVVLVF